ncbi:hypothetical protein NQ315_011967 [Exocentrus adspersus]|uniref:Phosphatase 2A Regulatory Subunit A helical domain-containing protein n=1 Tax=Exocentrus adspersus TaxID=1586481 RepID=A0AAV8W194_9CUCU|nr:hypothetical protein NQ315_011967 [Exocentrus adspersus]
MEEEPVTNEFEIFKEAMLEENLELQIDITKKLSILAKHLGVETTRNELLPFIKENIDYHDEILLNLCEQLRHFIPLVGGYQHSKPILDILIKLCNTDETIVRDKAVEILRDIGENMSEELTQDLFLPVVEVLAAEDWFTSKCSAAALYSTIYTKVSDGKKAELRNSFRVLMQDDSPIVRKVAAIHLLDLISIIDADTIKNEFIPVFDNLANDPMDSVRVFAVDVALALAKRLTENEIEEFIFKTIETWAESASWRIRQRLAYYIGELQRVIPFGKTRGKILALFQKLVKDTEPEVRIVIARNLFDYSKALRETYTNQPKFEDNFEPVFQQSIMPQVHLLITDPSHEVKLALSSNILALSTVLREECFKKNILPLLVDVLENEASMLIQANMLQNLNCLPSNIDLTLSMHSIKNVVRSLIINSQSHWRTRRSIFVAFMHIAKFSSKEYFAENLKIFYAALLGDPVFAIRRTAPIILPLLAKQYGISWTSENIIPYFTMFTKDCRYLYRFVPIFGIIELINPSLDCNSSEGGYKYLKDLKRLVESSDNELKTGAVKVLAKITRMLDKLNKELNQDKFKEILSLNEYISDFKHDTIDLYAGETLDVLKVDNNCDIFSVKEDAILKNHTTYIEGVLSLIFREFLFIIETLNDDLIENIQIRSVYTLNKIRQFLDELGQELNQAWVRDSLKLLNEEDIKIVDKQVDDELSRKVLDVDEGKMKIDTELMVENIITPSGDSLPDLGNIPELEVNSNNADKDKEEEAVLKPEGDIVVPEISESKLEQEDGGPIYLNLQTEKDTKTDDTSSKEVEDAREVNNNSAEGKAEEAMDVEQPSSKPSS